MVNGGYDYGYLFIAQNSYAETFFNKFLSLSKPSRILEIGTMHGGLTLLLRDIMDDLGLKDSLIRTYDIYEQEFLKPLATNRNIEILTQNLFNDEYTEFLDQSSKLIIENFIRQSGRTIVMCDGGCKKCEFRLISPLLKVNDIIMAHDYAPNERYFNRYIKNRVWDWLEIQDSDIEDIITSNNLNPYHQNLAQKAAWLSKIKEN